MTKHLNATKYDFHPENEHLLKGVDGVGQQTLTMKHLLDFGDHGKLVGEAQRVYQGWKDSGLSRKQIARVLRESDDYDRRIYEPPEWRQIKKGTIAVFVDGDSRETILMLGRFTRDVKILEECDFTLGAMKGLRDDGSLERISYEEIIVESY